MPIDLFERIENVFRRLETYIEVPPTAGMTDVIVKVMVEVLRILAIATKEIKQNRASELIIRDRSTLSAYCSPEKFLKKIVGGKDIEDALQRLEKVTVEEARMAAAEALKAIHGVGNQVDDTVHGVQNTLKVVEDRMRGVEGMLQGVGDMLQGVDNRVKDIGNKVTIGAQTVQLVICNTHCFIWLGFEKSGGQTPSDVDAVAADRALNRSMSKSVSCYSRIVLAWAFRITMARRLCM